MSVKEKKEIAPTSVEETDNSLDLLKDIPEEGAAPAAEWEPQTPPEADGEPAPKEEVVSKADYEALQQRYLESSREAIILNEKIKQQKAQETPLNDDDMRKAFPQWDQMSDTEMALAKRTLEAERVSKKSTDVVQSFLRDKEFESEIEDFIGSDEKLKKNAEDFKKYARKNKSLPLDVVRKAFLFDKPEPPISTKKPPVGLETGAWSQVPSGKPDDDEQMAILMKTDPREYRRRLLAKSAAKKG